MEDGERSCSDSDDGSSASWVILDGDGGAIGEDGDGLGNEPEPSADQPGTDAREEQAMDSSGDSAKTVIEQTDVPAVGAGSGASPPESAKMEEGSDIEVIGTEHAEDVYYEDDPMELSAEVAEEAGGASVPLGGAALPTETVLRQRRAARDAARDSAEDRDRSADRRSGDVAEKTDQPAAATEEHQEGPEADQEGPEADQEGPEADRRGPTVQPVSLDSEKDRWADDTDLSSLTDQPVVDVSDAGRLRQYVHQRNNTVNHLLTVVLVLCFTCVLGLGVGHFLGWLHHHELTEEMVHTLDEKLDVLRDDLMTCMTTEDDQDLDNKWIRELLTENEALLNQLHHGEDEQRASADSGPLCSPAGYAQLRDQVNQLRMENDELKAAIAKMRYGTTSQNGHVLRRHWDQINQLVTENGELARELRRTRYLQPPAGLTLQEDDPAQSAGQLSAESEYTDDSDSDSDSAAVSPEFLTPSAAFDSDSAESAYLSDDSAAPFTTFSPDSDPVAAESGSDDSLTHGWESQSESESAAASDGLLSALLGWHPAPGSVPLQEARRRLWSLWQEASDFSRAEPASKYVNLADRSLAKVERTLLKSLQKVQQLGRDMLQDDRAVGGARQERVTEKLARKVEKVVSKLDARWREIRTTWEGKVTAREAEHPLPTAAEVPVVPRAPNASDPSVAAYYARRSQHRQRARGEDGVADNWQMGRGRSRAEMRGAFHGASWLLERAQARQQLRQRRGEDAEPTARATGSNTWRREQTGRRGESDVPPPSDDHSRRQWQQWSAADSADSSSEEHHGRRQWQQWGSADSDDSSSEEDDDDDDDDYEEHAARLARHMAATAARFQQRVEKTVRRHASNLDRKARENHWKHFGGRNRHQFHHQHQRVHKY